MVYITTHTYLPIWKCPKMAGGTPNSSKLWMTMTYMTQYDSVFGLPMVTYGDDWGSPSSRNHHWSTQKIPSLPCWRRFTTKARRPAAARRPATGSAATAALGAAEEVPVPRSLWWRENPRKSHEQLLHSWRHEKSWKVMDFGIWLMGKVPVCFINCWKLSLHPSLLFLMGETIEVSHLYIYIIYIYILYTVIK